MKRDPWQPPKPAPPYDQVIANNAAAIDQAMKLGAVILTPKGTKPTGFSNG